MWLLIMLGTLCFILGTGIGIKYIINPIPTLFVSLGIIFITAGILNLEKLDKPTAMEVYQGKTTLEITYKEGVPIDSVVVFKNKKK